MEVVICEICENKLSNFDLRMQTLLQGICLDCGKANNWDGMNPADTARCAELHRWLNMTDAERIAYDRNRGY